MQQVKVFTNNGNEHTLERMVNEWLKTNPNLKIVNVLQSQSEDNYNVHITMTFIYEREADGTSSTGPR